MIKMKKYLKQLLPVLPLLLLVLLGSCKKNDGYTTPISTDKTKPGVITDIKVKNLNGAAYITYALPNSPNLLYVMAQYNINGKTVRQTKSSYYTDTVLVEGFAKSKDYSVTLWSVSRANVQSDPVTVTVHPDTPYYLLVKPTIKLAADFGGVNLKAINRGKSPVGVILIALDNSTQALEVQDQHYTNADSINYSVRGYPATPRQFGAYVTDKYGNTSDTTTLTITPIFETLLDKSKFSIYKTPSDSPTAYGWEVPYLWDNKTDGYSNGWHTAPAAPPPIQCTFSMGISAQLSRFIMWERPDQYSYAHGNPKDFSIWGSNKPAPQDAVLPQAAPVGTVVGDWINIGNFHYPDPPSGLTPGFTNAADNTFVAAGVNFDIPPGAPVVRYFRLLVHDTWSNGDFAHVMEFSIYGKPQ
ncbi:MAG TPA: DUF5000 domain-containing lipoprotein [Mucilaginibacter sp.]|nr:DUF5000 domain-containing lipoprotein [Mucilaginibacter sp.]